MHPEMTGQLAQQHRRDMMSGANRVQLAETARRSGHARRSRVRALLPRYRLTWTRTTLAVADSAHPQRSWVLVISATRAR